ncbi:MAG: geranylgeranylglycerol-phosphate geranylgeranyltransferase [Spirosomataceae bacterium]
MSRPLKKASFWQSFFGFFRLIRWQNLSIIVFTQYLTRVFLIGPAHAWKQTVLEPALFWICLSTVLIAAAGYIINDYYDIKIDIINKPKRVIIGRLVKRRIAMGAHLTINVSALCIGWMVDKKVFAINALAIFCLWLYSNQLKRMPFWGNLMVAVLTGLTLIVLAVHYRHHQQEVYLYALFAFSITLIREIIKDMEDVRGDASFGCQTLPILWGLRRTKWFLYGLLALFVGLLLGVGVWLGKAQLLLALSVVLIPAALLGYRLVKADTRQEFAYLSNLCKFIMLIGVLSMIWV